MTAKEKEALVRELDQILNKTELRANELEKIAKKCGWKMREPPKNQPHFYKRGVPEFIVIDKRYGPRTIQKPRLWSKYIKRLKESL